MDEEAWPPSVRIIKLTKEREIEPYPRVHPDEERWGRWPAQKMPLGARH
jgi:hypothetical protein